MPVNVLCVGDVVGKPGRSVLADHLKQLIDERKIDLVVCNAENAAGGSGLTPQIFKKLLNYGVDVITLGDHVYKKLEIVSQLRESSRLIRPANLPSAAIGRRWTVTETKCGLHKAAVVCLLGQVFMRNCDSPWTTIDEVLGEIPAEDGSPGFDVDTVRLFSESCTRFLVEVAPENAAAFEQRLAGMAFARIGEVTERGVLEISGVDGSPVIKLPVEDLREAFGGEFQG